jgi:hypothetical protein
VVRWLLDRGVSINEQDLGGCTALYLASCWGHPPVVRLLLERGTDPTIASQGVIPLMITSGYGHTEVVRCLLAHPSADATINQRDDTGRTALWHVCFCGGTEIVRLLLKHGADPTIADNDGTTPMAIAQNPRHGYRGRPECVAALKVRVPSVPLALLYLMALAEGRGLVACWRGGQEAERAYLLWKAWQVADAAASFAAAPVMEGETEGEAARRRVEAVPEELRGRAAAGGGGALPAVTVVVEEEGKEGRTRAALLEHAVHSLKPGVFEELMEMMG